MCLCLKLSNESLSILKITQFLKSGGGRVIVCPCLQTIQRITLNTMTLEVTWYSCNNENEAIYFSRTRVRSLATLVTHYWLTDWLTNWLTILPFSKLDACEWCCVQLAKAIKLSPAGLTTYLLSWQGKLLKQKLNISKQDQVNNADSAIIFLIHHWSVRIVKVVWSVRVVEVVQDVQIVHDWHAWPRSQGLKVSRS